MKRFLLAVGLMLLLIAAGIFSLWHAKYSRTLLTAQIGYIQSSALNDPVLRVRETRRLVEMWTERKEFLMHHVRHGSMDEIGSALSRATVYADEGDTLHLRAELAELYWLFNSIYEDEAVTFDNIF